MSDAVKHATLAIIPTAEGAVHVEAWTDRLLLTFDHVALEGQFSHELTPSKARILGALLSAAAELVERTLDKEAARA